jgi:hypothetical protein
MKGLVFGIEEYGVRRRERSSINSLDLLSIKKLPGKIDSRQFHDHPKVV